ncbi:TatD family hydrolase [Sphaerotilus sp.]|uniref:TatD family hydrolase n=1 Tax=Sphaerotilus sp. TaxID=2093942 RepID=UPI002ACDFF9F|nr:TatD family hydrolase [Sphaerotilus sp.]MDZ7855512.1 TatD family hydrolase [Sphaerotilus sp.]
MPTWIDSHCHLDAPEFDADRPDVCARAAAAGVALLVMPAVDCAHFDAVRALAHASASASASACVYALGLHPLYVHQQPPDALMQLETALDMHRGDTRLVAVGEIGLDGFVAGLDWAVQERFFVAQTALARQFDLPVILHVRRSADALLKHLRRAGLRGGIAHAFNGSAQQAHAFLDLGFRLGFGGALTFDRALQIRRLAQTLPADAIVLETDAPDIPPHWRYRTAAERAQGLRSRNEPAELPRIAETLAALRGWTLEETAAITSANACAALPRLTPWWRA